MSRTPEQKLWERLKHSSGRYKRLPGHTERLENSVNSGDPDVRGIVDNMHYDVELKVNKLKGDVDPLHKSMLRPSQTAWHYRWYRHGHTRIFVLIEQQKSLDIFRCYGAEYIKVLSFKKPVQWSEFAFNFKLEILTYGKK